jgi:phosphoglycerate dehydrogenase-like enzyme
MARVVTEIELDGPSLRRLEALPGVELTALPHHERDWELPPELGAVALLCKWPPRNLDALPGLRLIQLTSVGYEHLRDRGLGERAVRVCNARGVYDTAIAEWNVAMMINLARDLPGMLRNQQHGVWDRADRFGQDVRGRVVGLWGYGGIGRETARLARALGLTVHVLTRHGVGPRERHFAPEGTGDSEGKLPDRAFRGEEKEAFLSGLDFLVLALPHTTESDGLVGEAELKALPRRAYLLNPARGPIVREEALLRALRERWIAGAALDTHFAYPLPADHPLWRFPNVILTPHVSGWDRSPRFPARMAELFARNVERLLAGRPLLNELTCEEWREARVERSWA